MAEGRNMEMLVLDETRADIGLPVAKAIAPGMRQFRARFAPRRLYEVPAALGRLDRPLKEADLNLIWIFP